MLLSYITNIVFLLIYVIYPPLTFYFIALRPIGNDFETVLVPWTFYLTHPAFNKRKLITPVNSSKQVFHKTI
uniref:Serpentine receptor class gamma n=1 Tax=Caenorhabditis japonica TaxID=281687 RepID=A0A8R1DJC7_CAEJA